jgi:hypothetical protein
VLMAGAFGFDDQKAGMIEYVMKDETSVKD